MTSPVTQILIHFPARWCTSAHCSYYARLFGTVHTTFL